jgi:MFS family permease
VQTDKRLNKRYYGWYIAITLAITETISWGIIYYSFSVFITPMETELGWSRAELTGGFSLALLVAGALAYPVGHWIDRHGSRGLMTIGSILASLLVIAWSQVRDHSTFYLIWMGLGVCAATVLYEPAFAVIATWFVRQRGKALAVITFTAGLASTIFIPLSDALRTALGWRQAILMLGILLALTTIPLHALILRRRPADLGLLPDGDDLETINSRPIPKAFSLSEAINSRFFWMLILAFSLAAFAAAAIRVHFIPFLIGSGIDASTAALASGSIGIMQVMGRIIFVPLEERYAIRVMVVAVFALQAAALFTLLFGLSLWVVVIFVMAFGAGQGAQTLARASIIGSIFGASHYGRISSIMAIFLTLANTAAPVSAGLIYDHFGSYTPILWIVVGLALSAGGVMALTKPDALRSVEIQELVAPIEQS